MIDAKIIQEIQDAPIEERLQLMEQILETLKQDIQKPIPQTPFVIRTFNLGKKILVDRDHIYSERTI